MVDNTKPTEQFHRYTTPDAVPVSERSGNRWTALMSKAGVSGHAGNLKDTINGAMSGPTVTSARTYARKNPGKVLGGLAALVIGIGLIRKRSHG